MVGMVVMVSIRKLSTVGRGPRLSFTYLLGLLYNMTSEFKMEPQKFLVSLKAGP